MLPALKTARPSPRTFSSTSFVAMPAPKSTKEGPGVRRSMLRPSLTGQVPLDKQEKLHLVRRHGF